MIIKCSECGYHGESKVIMGDRSDLSYGELDVCPECNSEYFDDDDDDDNIDSTLKELFEYDYCNDKELFEYDYCNDDEEQGDTL